MKMKIENKKTADKKAEGRRRRSKDRSQEDKEEQRTGQSKPSLPQHLFQSLHAKHKNTGPENRNRQTRQAL